jgi:uncharacterized protein
MSCARFGPPVEAVYGNGDEPSLKASLERTRVLDVEGARIGVVHVPGPGVGRGERLLRRFPGCAAVVFGHTHIPQVDRYEGVWLLNPGSAPRPDETMIVLGVDAGSLAPKLVDFGP